MKRKSLLFVSVMAVAAVATAFVVWAPAPVTAPSTDVVDNTPDNCQDPGLPPGSAALRATINSETGAVEVSTVSSYAPLDAETQNALRRDSEGLTPVYHPDGSVSVHLQGRLQSVSVARIEKNGKLVICSEHADQIDGILQKRAEHEPAAQQDLEVR